MKFKRFLSIVLALSAVFSLGAAALAAQAAGSTPNPKIEYAYTTTVAPGTIRFTSQNTGSGYFYADYWGAWADKAKHECLTACISMALSYVGVSATPGYILDTGSGTTLNANSWGGSKYSSIDFNTAFNNYVNGQGRYSPPIIHLNSYSSGGHYVLVIAKLSDGTYQVADPYEDELWTLSISGNTVAYNYYGAKTDSLSDAMQYYYDNGGIKEQPEPTAPAAEPTELAFTIGSKSYVKNGLTKTLDVAPYMKNNRTYLPARAVCEELGADVVWDNAARSITITRGSTTIVLTINSTRVLLNGKAETLATAPEITGGRTFLPIRYVAEALGAAVSWQQSTKTAMINLS